MIRTSSLYEACGDLFAGYPLAVTADGSGGSAQSMVLVRHDGGDARFFILTGDHDDGQPGYSLSPWHAPGGVDIGPGAVPDAVPDAFADVIKHGVPVPRHGSLCGWQEEGTITALIPFYAEYTPESPLPSWATMPLAGLPEAEWPPFADEPLFAGWFWEHYQAGSIVLVDGLIAATPGVVFWADTAAVIGSGCCVVAHDIRGPEGPMLQRGRYVYYQALRAGKPVPSLKALLADPGKIDLAPRFQW
ncbi:MAG TPA: hypothetical protein VEC76_09845 [Streptosporangiaceae bacterium]|nr:hypothetical protein [Streptosporangiaceae bacterium]